MSLNESEEKLGALAKKTFLSMWSYENAFYKSGKELCDVLIVFGNDVIMISDKFIQFGDHPRLEVNWQRWYNKAVSGSLRQLSGAKSHILNFPEQLYVDAKASIPLPLKLPPLQQMRIHLLAVANGCEEACQRATGQQSLYIATQAEDGSKIFTVGCQTHKGDFVHVISMPALDAMFDSFDTARDFIDYLVRKQAALEKDAWLILGEENLIAAYMTSQQGDQAFSIPADRFPCGDTQAARTVMPGLWTNYLESELRDTRLKLWANSYMIDRMIELTSADYANGGMIVGQDKPASYHEAAFRHLAGESRLSRQAIAASYLEIYTEPGSTFWCTFCRSLDDPQIYYLWLLYPQPRPEWPLEEVEQLLGAHLSHYLLVAQSKHREAKLIFGICAPLKQVSTMTTVIYKVANMNYWSPQLEEKAKMLMKEYGILESIFDFTARAIR